MHPGPDTARETEMPSKAQPGPESSAPSAQTLSKRRIGFLWTLPKPGQRCVFRQATGSRRFHPVIFTREPSEFLLEENLTVEVLRPREASLVKQPGQTLKRKFRAVVEAVGEAKIDLLHVFHGDKGVTYLPALRELNVPVTVSFHGRDVEDCLRDPRFSPKLPELFSVAATIMPCSLAMSKKLIEAGCPPEKIMINHWSIPMERFPFKDRAITGTKPFIFLQACRLVDKKGLPDTIEAFGLVAAKEPQTELWIAGEGELRGALEAQVESAGLARKVKFLGFLEEAALVEALHSADLFLHPSVTTSSGDQEGIPNALLEAMATGLPAIATRHAGIPEVISDGVTGWLVDEHSPKLLAERMSWAMGHPAQLRAMGRAGRDLVAERFSADAGAQWLDQTYGQIIEAFANRRRGVVTD